MSGIGNTTKTVGPSGNQLIDGILIGSAWADATIRYSVPTSAAAYDYSTNGLQSFVTNGVALGAAQFTAIHFALNADVGSAASAGFSVEGFTAVNIFYSGNGDFPNDHLRILNTSADLSPSDAGNPPARVADFPTNLATPPSADNGDVWFRSDYQSGVFFTPQAGNYAWATHLHEIGHAIGLKHGHDTGYSYGALPFNFDSMEYSIMTYKSYVGAGTGSGYTNETWGYAQSFMMADIAALQHMYGADFTTNSGNTTYKWNPNSGDTLVNGAVGIDAGGNRIFATIWDGGGIDTYDLSSYSTNLMLDLSPGGHSLFSSTQIANLGNGNFARGNIFNALQYMGDSRSLIENAIGGSGNDTIIGNSAANNLSGGSGNDTLFGGPGADTIDGGGGIDTLSFAGATTGMTLVFTSASAGQVFAGDPIGGDTFTGIENILGGDMNDVIGMSDGNNFCDGGGGDDIIFGWNGSDTIRGGNGNDQLFGQFDDDNLQGGEGNDILYGFAGADTLNGGNGADIFRRTVAGESTDIILDYSYSQGDMIDVIENPTQVIFGQFGTDVLIFTPDGTEVLFQLVNYQISNGLAIV